MDPEMIKCSFALLLACAVCACGGEGSGPESNTRNASDDTADRLYVNGVIWTGVTSRPDASVLAIRDGIVSYVGHGEIPAHETIDLEGRFVMPGFIDNHVHFLDGGAGLASVDLRDAATPEAFATRIADHARSIPDGQWVRNGNWDHQLWGGKLPHKEWIDDQTPDTPVFVIRLDGHMALANSVALKRAGISAETPEPEGGRILRDADRNPTGILKGNALNLVMNVLPEPSDEEILSAFERAQSHALSVGLTQVHAVTAGPTETSMLDAFQLAADRGVMKIRAHVFTPLEDWQKQRQLASQNDHSDGKLRWGGLKGFVDGSLGAGTAWFHEPYTDEPGMRGLPLTEPTRLRTMLAGAHAAGMRLAIHAIGDSAIDQLIANLRSIAGSEITDRRYRIEHFQHPTRAAIEAAAASGIIASMQPYHAIDDGRWAERRIGPERIQTTYAFRSILDAGVTLTFGSDWPVAPLSPLEGIYAAATRRTIDGAHPEGWQPQEKITVEEALTAYTASNAYAVFEEDRGGTLEVGKRGDFVVLSADPRAVDPIAIRDIAVHLTVIDGKTVFKAPAQRPPVEE